VSDDWEDCGLRGCADWAEDFKLLGNMDLVNALAAVFHLCFDLKYPKVKKGSMLETL